MYYTVYMHGDINCLIQVMILYSVENWLEKRLADLIYSYMNIIKIVLYDFEPLLYIFNQIIHTSNIVNQMKIAIIIPIYI